MKILIFSPPSMLIIVTCRLVYSWVNVDQEVSLFYDTTPLLSVSNIHLAMPSSDALWKAASASDWSSLYQAQDARAQPVSLSDLFKQFMEDGLLHEGHQLEATHLRLLLHPLQGLCSHLGQYLGFFSSNAPITSTSRLIVTSASRTRLDEVRTLLQQWFALYTRSSVASSCDPAVSTALVIYHLLSLSTFTCFQEIEELARQEPGREPFRGHFNLRMRSMESAEEIFFHCGQVLRLLCLLKRTSRPIWWPAAIYRVALICFVTSTARAGSQFGNTTPGSNACGPLFSINTLPPEDSAVQRYLKSREGTPMLTKRNGTLMPVEMPETVLEHCIEVLEEDLGTRLAEGIRNRLVKFTHRWIYPEQNYDPMQMYPPVTANLVLQ
jgi:hypothetical protein